MSGEQIMITLEAMDKATIARLDEILKRMSPPRTGPYRRSAEIDKLGAALAKAQADIVSATKDAQNPHFGQSYADLASVWDACRGPLSKNELSVTQLPSFEGNMLTLTSILLHSSGQYIETDLKMPVSKPDAHGLGSAITYARRYSLSALVGVAPDDDDDGTAAVKKTKDQEPPKTKPAAGPKPKDEAAPKAPTSLDSTQVAAIKALALQRAEDGWTIERVKEFALAAFKVDSPSKLHPSKLDELMGAIKSMTAEKALLIARGGETP